jgi:outer membrane protein TolC
MDLVATEEQALQEVQAVLLSLQDADQFVQSQKLSQERAEEGLRLAEVGYREGIQTSVDVLDARAALTAAKGFYYNAIFDHAIARLAYARALGILGPTACDTAERDEETIRREVEKSLRSQLPREVPVPVTQ